MHKRKLCFEINSTVDVAGGINSTNEQREIILDADSENTCAYNAGTKTSLDDFFQYDGIKNSTICLVDGCEIKFTNYYKSTLRRHIISFHPELLDIIEPIKRRCTPKEKCGNSRIMEIRKLLVELTTVHGRPIAIVDDEAMVKILNMAADSKEKMFTAAQLQKDIFEAERQIKCSITGYVKGKMVSVLTDIASRYGRSILGVNIQYIIDNDLVIRTVGTIRMKSAHSGKYIAELIRDNLQMYGISIDHIYTYTSDNGANVVKAREELEKLIHSPQEEHEPADDTSNDDHIVEAILADEDDEGITLSSMSTPNFDRPTADNCHSCLMCQLQTETDPDRIQSITEHINAIFAMNENGQRDCVAGLLCAAHTLQLAINDAIKKLETKTGLLRKAKDVCLRLRRQNILDIISSRKLPMPILNNVTRWNSTFCMVFVY